jgi:outer membrane receptor for monomeric catechols
MTETGAGRGYVVRESSIGTKLAIPLIELPQAAQVITKQVIPDQAATQLTMYSKMLAAMRWPIPIQKQWLDF